MKFLNLAVISLFATSALFGADVVKIERMSIELASKVAELSLKECRKKGFWVSAVVVDKSANVQVVMRDTYAARFTIDIAREKANATIMSGIDTSTFISNRADIKNELNNIDGLIMMKGGVPIKSGDIILGAVGVSGAPGGKLDAQCAIKATSSLKERLAFAVMESEE